MVLRTTSCIFALALSASYASAASAEEAAPQNTVAPEQTGLAEIVVTAQKRAEPLQSVPVAVTALDGDLMQKARIDGPTGLKGLVPGMTINRSGAAAQTPQLSLRGISIQDVLPSTESGIGFTIDGIPIAFQRGVVLDAFDVERLEVLRGPQGVLSGRNTTGGTINVLRSRPNPDGDVTGKMRVTLGSFGQNDYEGVISVPIVPGILAVKGAVTIKKNTGTFENIVYGGRDGDRDLQNYNVAVVANPSDRLSIYLSYDRIIDNSDIPPFVPLDTPSTIAYPVPGYFGGANILCFNPNTVDVCTPLSKSRNTVESKTNPARFDSNTFTADIGFELSDDLKLVSVTGYRDFGEHQLSYFDATRYNLFADRADLKAKQFSEEARLETTGDGPFNIVAGAFFMSYSYDETQRNSLDFAAISPVATPGEFFLNSLNSYQTLQHNRTFAVFAQADYKITEQLKLTVGGRQTWDRKRTDYSLYGIVPGAVRDTEAYGPLVGRVTAAAKFSQFTPKVGLQFQITPTALTYASFSRGYNTGGFNGRSGNLVAAVTPYKPEKMDAFEVGLKSEFFNRHVRLNLSAFHNTLDDKQENVLAIFGTTNSTSTVNIAKAKYYGVEAELAVVPLRNWTISGSAGYLHAKYDQFTADIGQGTQDLSVLKLRRTPKWTAGLISDYSFDVGPGNFGMNAAVYYTSRYETDILNDPRGSIPPVAKVDLGVRYELPVQQGLQLELSTFVKNLTDNTTYDGVTSGNTVGTFVEFASPQVGRTWGVSLGVKF